MDKKTAKKLRRQLRGYKAAKTTEDKQAFVARIKDLSKGLTPEAKKTYSERYGFAF